MTGWKRSEAQMQNIDTHRLSMNETLVPKDLRKKALAISDGFTGEKRMHAYSWLKSHRRTRSEIQSFIDRNSHALPHQTGGGAVQPHDVAPPGGLDLPR